MGKILLGITVALASLMLVEPLKCNKCDYGVASYCLKNSEATCEAEQVCVSQKATFPAISDNLGFFTLGCRNKEVENEPNCEQTLETTAVLGIKVKRFVTCCDTDKCNEVQLSGAPSTKMTLTGTIAAAILASMCGSLL
ncbi:uncharacterized protein LOC143335683 [Chaetodon auriga]|uniref:uncharacterized protein LOC143335683 n=1 Tax=Chaetodon auriga TaxID=39042 RepID=UPI004032CEEE